MPKTVLIVDDVAFVRRTLAEIVSRAGYHVVAEAANGSDAVTQFEKLRPDAVTMDVVMPEMSGIEATRHILKIDPAAKVIMVSAMGQENLVMEAIDAGARDYVLKPFKGEEILKALDRVTGGADDRRRPPQKGV